MASFNVSAPLSFRDIYFIHYCRNIDTLYLGFIVNYGFSHLSDFLKVQPFISSRFLDPTILCSNIQCLCSCSELEVLFKKEIFHPLSVVLIQSSLYHIFTMFYPFCIWLTYFNNGGFQDCNNVPFANQLSCFYY